MIIVAVAVYIVVRSEAQSLTLPPMRIVNVSGLKRAEIDAVALNRFVERYRIPTVPDFGEVAVETARDIHTALSEIAARPKDSQAFGQLGRVFHSHEYTAKALACYTRARELGPGEHEWSYYIGRIHADAFEHEPAIRAFEVAAELDSTYAPTFLVIGKLYLQIGNAQKARNAFERFIELRPKSGHGYLGVAQSAFDRQEFDVASAFLQQAVVHSPNDFRVHNLLAQTYRQLGNVTKAEYHLAIVSSKNRQDELRKHVYFDDPLYHRMLAANTTDGALAERLRAAMATGQTKVAIRLATELCHRQPNDARRLHSLALACKQAKKFKESLACTEKAIRIDSDFLEAHLTRAQLLMIARRLEEAGEVLDRIVEQHPNSFDAHYYRGTAMVLRSRYQAAVPVFRRAVELNEREARAHVALAEALMQSGRRSEATEEYRRALELDASNARALQQLRLLDGL